METFLGGIAVIALSGLTWLAYHHPEAYATVCKAILIILGLIIFGSMFIHAAVNETWMAVEPFIDPARVDAAKRAADGVAFGERLHFYGLVAFAVYLVFLWSLPDLLNKRGKTD